MFPNGLSDYANTLRAVPEVVALRQIALKMGIGLWITGGTLRDVLLGRWPKDLDLAVDGDAMALGKRLAKACGGTFVPLDPATGTARVAIQSGQGIDWIDLVRLRATTIEADLALRDFTINAIALALDNRFDNATGELIDPTGGRDDLHAQRLIPTSANAMIDDPLRLLRGYRVAAKLGFSLSPEFRAQATQHAALITRPAGERSGAELLALLTTPNPADTLAAMMDDGVLAALSPELAATRQVNQNDYHHLDVWQHSVETVRQLTGLFNAPDPLHNASPFAPDDADTRTALMLAALFHDVGKPTTRTEDDRVHFYDHDQIGAKQWRAIAKRLRLPGALTDRVERLIAHHLRPLLLAAQGNPQALSPRAADRLYRAVEGDVDALFMLALADSRASQGPAHPGDAELQLLAVYTHLRAIHRTRVAPVDATPPLINGHELMALFDLPPGPAIGQLLTALRQARIDGSVATRDDALLWIQDNLPK